MTNRQLLQNIRNLCIINFLEIQEIKRKMDIKIDDTETYREYANLLQEYMMELDTKSRNLVKDYHHLSVDMDGDQ